MTAFIALVRKDLLLYLADRRALARNLIMPILLGAFFGYLFGGSRAADQDKARIEIAVVAHEDSTVSRRIVAALESDEMLKVRELGQDEARGLVREGKIVAAIVIPAGFGNASVAAFFRSNAEKPEITIFYDPSQDAALQLIRGLLTQHVMQVASTELFSGVVGRTFVDASVADLDRKAGTDESLAPLRSLLKEVQRFQTSAAGRGESDAAAPAVTAASTGISMPFSMRDEAVTSGPEKYNGYAHSFAGMGVQFIMFMGIDVGIGVLLARRQGLWARLLATPVSLRTLLLARAVSCALIAMCILGVIFAVGMLIFGIRINGSLAGLVGVSASFSAMTATFGLCVAAFGRTPEAARGIAVFATLILVMLGGAWVPSFIFPNWLQTASLIMPTRWAVDGFDAMTWRGLDGIAALQAMTVLTCFALAFWVLALRQFRDARE